MINQKQVIKPAGFWIRFIASVIDLLIAGIIMYLIPYMILGTWFGDSPINLFFNLVSILYFLLLPVLWNGYTVGKRLFGIRIVKINGGKLGIGAMLMRDIIGGLIYAITLGIALIASAFIVGFRQDKRSIHDLVARTYVINEKS